MKKTLTLLKNRISVHFLFILILIAVSNGIYAQNVGINSTGASPNPSAGLDVDFPDKGVLIPRIPLTSTTSFAPMAAHVAGMIVYNTATTGDVTPGLYYNNGNRWVTGFPSGNATGNMIYWNGTAWVMVPAGTPGQYLQVGPSNIPFWGGAAYATLATTAITAITASSASSGGTILNDGGSPVLVKGVCWNSTPNPTTGNNITSNGTGTTTYTSSLTGLLAGTIYYVRAYSTNNSVISYGNELSFSTMATLSTTAATLITANAARTGGIVTSGNAPVIERGVCYATTSNPTTANSKLINPAPGAGTFTSDLTGLNENTVYYVRSYAINASGTAYGAQISFTTLSTLTTTDITAITPIAASGGGTILIGGGATISVRGVCWSTSPSPTTALTTKTINGTGTGTFTSAITGLAASTLYYIRAYATNAGGTSYGNELTFTTLPPVVPTVTTTAVTAINTIAATSGGNVTSDGGAAVTARGICWSTSPGPTTANSLTTNGTGIGAYTSNMTGLSPSTTYFVRAYATNSAGTAYGSEVTFATCGLPIYTMGQSLAGGIVYYIDCTGQHGLIVATADQGVDVSWGCSGTLVGASGTAIYTGLANTNAIIAGCATAGIAARLCANYTAGGQNLPGFTNWYLPSRDELQLMKASGYVSPPSSLYSYWSSSEGSATTAAGWFFYGNYQVSAIKSGTTQFAVRAVRAF